MTGNKSVMVPRQFAAEFEFVAERYNLRDLAEYDLVKKIARDDIENAIPCYYEIAKETK